MLSHLPVQDNSVQEPLSALYQAQNTSPAWFAPNHPWLWYSQWEDAVSPLPSSQVVPRPWETSRTPSLVSQEGHFSFQASQQTSPASTEYNFKVDSNIDDYRQEKRRAQCRKSQRCHRAKKKRELEEMQEALRQTEARVSRLREENRQLLELCRLLKEQKRLFEEQRSSGTGP